LASTGATFVILMGSIDLSVGAIVLLVGAVVVTAINGLDLGLSAVLVGILLRARLGDLHLKDVNVTDHAAHQSTWCYSL
jgi:ribose/xylose/arabinose/galactoside ABC-type transport system permease subunit